MALVSLAACNLASGLSEFEVGGGQTSTSGGGSGGAAGTSGTGGTGGAGGAGGTGTSSGTGGPGGGGPFAVEVPVTLLSGDVEECVADGTMYLDSSDLELGEEQDGWGAQLVGLRFELVPVPRGATVLSARVDFVVDVPGSAPTSLTIHGQASDHAFPFLSIATDLSSRELTAAAVPWNDVPPWDQAGATQSSPDLSPIVQEIVDRQGWDADSALVLVIAGTGSRSAVASDYAAADAPSLHVEYLPP